MVMFFRAPVRRCFLLFLCLLATGCASWAGHGVTLYPEQKLRIAVLPVRTDLEVTSLKDIETIPEDRKEIPNEKELIGQAMQEVTENMTRSIEMLLNKSPYFEVVPHEEVMHALLVRNIPMGASLRAEKVEDIGKALDAQALLVVGLSGYGRLKGRWVAYLIGSGVVEGGVEGAVAGGATGNVWVGLAVALEEIGQEVVTWGGGSYLFNRYYAPVTLEGELISTKDGKKVWSSTAFDSIDRKALKKLPEEEQKKKEVQLKVTVEKTEKNLLESLEKAAKSNILKKTS